MLWIIMIIFIASGKIFSSTLIDIEHKSTTICNWITLIIVIALVYRSISFHFPRTFFKLHFYKALPLIALQFICRGMLHIENEWDDDKKKKKENQVCDVN